MKEEKKQAEESIRERLFAMQDPGYRDFHARLMPTVDKETVIGVRTPMLRKYAKELSKLPEKEVFMQQLPHTYYEENNLHGYLIEQIRDYDTCIREVERFLPYINNWATCDTMNPGVFKKHRWELLEKIRQWIRSDQIYTIRFGVGMLMQLFLDDSFAPEYHQWVAEIASEEYYVKMMAAWYFATALAKQYEATLPYLEEKRLDSWTHNKTIQKAVESYRITPEQKGYLRTLRRKETGDGTKK